MHQQATQTLHAAILTPADQEMIGQARQGTPGYEVQGGHHQCHIADTGDTLRWEPLTQPTQYGMIELLTVAHRFSSGSNRMRPWACPFYPTQA
jgi:hypothetical protein